VRIDFTKLANVCVRTLRILSESGLSFVVLILSKLIFSYCTVIWNKATNHIAVRLLNLTVGRVSYPIRYDWQPASMSLFCSMAHCH